MRPAEPIQYFIHIKRNLGIILLIGLIFSTPVFAQISPGDLAQPHSGLDGISQCTKCHTVGEKLTNANCLDCHKEIKTRITLQQGYHASKEVEGKLCYTCHSDHHGRKFQLIRFDQTKFDHHLTGYDLSGKHKEISCSSCHRPEFIIDEKLKAKKSTWLGLNSACKSCHQDYHQNTLSPNCGACHNQNSFKPASGFDHQKTAFPLKGKHAVMDCVKCHPVITREGKKFSQFAGLKFNNCTDCHKDPHNNSFGANCKSCHNEESFHKITSAKGFDHSRTHYPLTGKHQTVSCLLCHKQNFTKPLQYANCLDCHADFHKGQFLKNNRTTDCIECHTTEGFSKTTFDQEKHKTTSFPLLDSHQRIACSSCHYKTGSWQFKNVSSACKDCHLDYHQKQFNSRGCEECHNSRSFSDVVYTPDQHAKIYPLEGAHLATPCFSCHKKNGDKQWNFKTRTGCADCHLNIHSGYIPEKYFPNQDCRICHSSESWKKIAFNHALTAFPLKGRHQDTPCASCHLTKKADGKYEQIFSIKNKDCQSCHVDVHAHQFEKNGVTQCGQCHDEKNWRPEAFNHDQTGFKLGKSHEHLKCSACHETVKSESGNYMKFKINKTKCADCHS